jgi:2-polyprenyl-3-methyl-5-hydroxy-6-metoxy-1,4-benzoquinol methylase/GNAT superfamily N-acetyltransferase
MCEIALRKMALSDIPEVSRVICASFSWAARREGRSANEIDFYVSSRGSEGAIHNQSEEYLFWVATIGGQIGGVIAIQGDEITKLYVDPVVQGQKIGRMLFEWAERYVGQEGVVALTAWAAFDSAIPFYETMGMSAVGRKFDILGKSQGGNAMLMKKRLDQVSISSEDSMDEYIEANRQSWGRISRDHYETFKKRLAENESTLSQTQIRELGDLQGKSLIHLQCNTGADSISLARMGARITGVDLVPENIHYARKLAADFGIDDARFIESNVLEIMDKHSEKYDVVYTTEGVLCWLPDLYLWARNVRHLLADDGFLYVLDSHPFFMAWDEEKLPELVVKYPYFQKNTDEDEWIGGYASESKKATNYSWMYTIGEIVTALSQAGLHIEWLHEFDWLFYQMSAEKQIQDEEGNWIYPEHREKLPYTFSLKATIR